MCLNGEGQIILLGLVHESNKESLRRAASPEWRQTEPLQRHERRCPTRRSANYFLSRILSGTGVLAGAPRSVRPRPSRHGARLRGLQADSVRPDRGLPSSGAEKKWRKNPEFSLDKAEKIHYRACCYVAQERTLSTAW